RGNGPPWGRDQKGVRALHSGGGRMRWAEGFIAVDWGTTNRRGYRLGPGGRLEDRMEDGKGILSIPAGGFPAAVARIRERLGDGTRICHPGTHNKWIRLEDGRIASFRTVMTGELFSLLKEHSILADLLGGPIEPGRAFAAGVGHGHDHDDLTAELFSVRARVL